MGASSTDKVRNVVLVGHGGAGKTSLAEAMLFMAGETKRLGTVEDGHSSLDYDPEEIKRQMTVNLSLGSRHAQERQDQRHRHPRFSDFIGDAIAGMEVAEMALFVVDARPRFAGPDRAPVGDSPVDGHRPRGVHQPHGQGTRRLRRGHGQA